MADQQDPISPDEYVLRRISKDTLRYNPSLHEPITRLAFEPSKRDISGISVFRELFVSAETVAKAGRGANGCCVARLRASEIVALGLTIIPDPQDDQLPGHALIPELSAQQVKENKSQSKEIQHKLAKVAGLNIVYETE